MSRRLATVLALLLAAALALPSAAAAIDRAALAAKLRQETAKLGPASGALVVDLDTDEVLFSRRPDLRLVPASNEKLYTTAAALLRFSPTGTLTTEVRTAAGDAIDADGVLDGDLHLIGAGDPDLGEDDLVRLATDLRALGLEEVTGGVRGDESAFDLRRGGPDSGFAADLDLGGWLGALVYRHGRAFPGGPAKVAAARLQALLKDRGVEFGKAARSGALPSTDEEVPPLAAVESPTMAALSATTNQPSDNFYAEMLVKVLGARFGAGGTTASGIAVARAALRDLGVRPTLVDGSGLSRRNRTTARQLITLLDAMHERPEGVAFTASLPRPGGYGTLKRRMRGTAAASRCRAKTGTLDGVSALSGFCTAANGRTIAFSFLENGVYAPGAKRVEDRMVPAIARYSAPAP